MYVCTHRIKNRESEKDENEPETEERERGKESLFSKLVTRFLCASQVRSLNMLIINC